MINALTLSPALSALLLKPVDRTRRKFVLFRWFNLAFEKLTGGYTAIVPGAAAQSDGHNSALRLSCGVALVALRRPSDGFIPDEDQGAFSSISSCPTRHR